MLERSAADGSTLEIGQLVVSNLELAPQTMRIAEFTAGGRAACCVFEADGADAGAHYCKRLLPAPGRVAPD